MMRALLPLLLTLTALISLRPLLRSRPRGARETPFPGKALLLALSGTLGVGNITGVAAALLLGGRGSVFWMLLSALVALVLKCAEGRVSRRCGGVGMCGALLHLPQGEILASLWGAFAFFIAFVMGAALQASAIVRNAPPVLSDTPVLTGVLLALLVLLLLLCPVERVLSRLSVTLPLATVVYVFLCLGVIVAHIDDLIPMCRSILEDALSPLAAGGGALGFFTSRAMHHGYAAGLLSNEAGAGTSTLAQDDAVPACYGGCIGMLEVVLDTLVLCPLSALALLLSGDTTAATPSELLRNAFSSVLPSHSLLVLFLAITLFALSTVLCWYLYANRLLACTKRAGGSLRLPFAIAVFLGAVLPELWIVAASDTLLFFLCVLSSFALLSHARTGM